MQAICSSFPQLGLKGSFEMWECQAEMDYTPADTVLKKAGLFFHGLASYMHFKDSTFCI